MKFKFKRKFKFKFYGIAARYIFPKNKIRIQSKLSF